MPRSTSSLYVTFEHFIVSTEEVAQAGLHITNPAGITEGAAVGQLAALTDAELDELSDAWAEEIWGESLFGPASYGRFRGIKVAAVDQDGKYLAEARERVRGTPINGSKAQAVPQASTVLSLRSGGTLGQANFGRMYVPYSQPDLEGGTAQISAANRGFLANAAKLFLDRVNVVAAAQGTDWAVVNMSAVGSGTTKAVTQVAVDGIVDTQRRRSNRLTRAYATATLA